MKPPCPVRGHTRARIGTHIRVSGFRFRASDFGFRVSGFGFRVSDFGLRFLCPLSSFFALWFAFCVSGVEFEAAVSEEWRTLSREGTLFCYLQGAIVYLNLDIALP